MAIKAHMVYQTSAALLVAQEADPADSTYQAATVVATGVQCRAKDHFMVEYRAAEVLAAPVGVPANALLGPVVEAVLVWLKLLINWRYYEYT